jgi:peptidoglycan endopeptidase LytE
VSACGAPTCLVPEGKEADATMSSRLHRLAAATLTVIISFVGSLPVLADNAPENYVVQQGDTLTAIAAMAGTSVERLVDLNGLGSADTIFVGDFLLLVEPTPVRVVYRVQAGDTMTSIARQFGVEVAALAGANSIEDPNAISVAAELIIPDPSTAFVAAARAPAAATPSPMPTAPPTPQPTPTPTARPTATVTRAAPSPTPTSVSPAVGSYVVQPGDTLYSIAARLGVTPAALQATNQLASADRIFVGQRLTIPRVNASSASPGSQASPTNDIVTLARQYLGAPYVFGGTTPVGFDCSGFIFFVFNRAGRTIERDIWSQYDSGPHVTREQLQPGDLVFFQNTYMEGLSHNGIYVGNGEFINAIGEDSGVGISRLGSPYWADRWYGATRPRLG